MTSSIIEKKDVRHNNKVRNTELDHDVTPLLLNVMPPEDNAENLLVSIYINF